MITIITLLYYIYYLIWRLGTLNPGAMFISIVFLLAEAQGILNFFLFAFMTWKRKDVPYREPLQGLRVDIFVPTYNEDLDILESTLVGCNNVAYPHTTYVLDDGRRPLVQALAKRLGCEYITRTDNLHAKAGNINHAMKITSGEFIVIIDADTVPQPDFLHKTLGYFQDNQVAIVQLPQEFYNADSVQHVKRETPWHEQQLFYRVIQPGKNRTNSALWCGSPSVVRRRAIEDVGGVAIQSITEDLHTTLRLNSKGWIVKYHDENLAYGIAPQTFNAFSIQRLRWAQGSMQIFFSRENPLIKPGLTWKQRISHFASMWTYFDAYQKIVFLVIPSWYLLTHQMPMAVGPISFFLHWVPYFVLGMIGNLSLGRGYFHYFAAERYNVLKIFVFLRATITMGRQRRLRFRVTPKSVDSSVKKLDLIWVSPLFLGIGFSALSLVLGVVELFFNLYNLKTLAACIWTVFNIILFGIAAVFILRRRYFRSEYRFPTNLQGVLHLDDTVKVPVHITNLSLHGIGFVVAAQQIAIPERVSITLGTVPPLTLDVKVAYKGTTEDGGQRIERIGATILAPSEEARQELIRYLYIVVPRAREMRGHEEEAYRQAAAATVE